jgi:hypothetical protein
MVHQKNNDTDFDFDTQGIEMYVDGEWVRAKGTTLGADNGLGVATIMAILESTTIPHPAIEALFTIDEETGMTGAMGLKGGLLEGEILLNLDTEEDDEIDIGCAGGVDVTAVAEYDEEDTPAEAVGYTITVKGLNGGHSGMDIDKGLGNANKIMNRLLFDGFENFGLQIAEINGGSLRNAIPRESVAQIIVAQMYDEAYVFDMQEIINDIKTEYKTTEPNLVIEIAKSILKPGMEALQIGASSPHLTKELLFLGRGLGKLHVYEPRKPQLTILNANFGDYIIGNILYLIPFIPMVKTESLKISNTDPFSDVSSMNWGNSRSTSSVKSLPIDEIDLNNCKLLILQHPFDAVAAIKSGDNLFKTQKPMIVMGPIKKNNLREFTQEIMKYDYEVWVEQPVKVDNNEYLVISFYKENKIGMKGFTKVNIN